MLRRCESLDPSFLNPMLGNHESMPHVNVLEFSVSLARLRTPLSIRRAYAEYTSRLLLGASRAQITSRNQYCIVVPLMGQRQCERALSDGNHVSLNCSTVIVVLGRGQANLSHKFIAGRSFPCTPQSGFRSAVRVLLSIDYRIRSDVLTV